MQSERTGAAPRHSRKRHRNTERESAQIALSRIRSRDLWYAKLPFDHSAKRLISYFCQVEWDPPIMRDLQKKMRI